MITTWSFSRLSDFEQCPLRAKLKYIDKIPEPERPLPPGKTEHANDRGTRIHTLAENYVQGKCDFPRELEKFRPEFEALREFFDRGKVSLEGEWAHDRDWQPVGWSTQEAWLRLKIDALVFISPTTAVVIDYKTGKRFGNEIKHAEQTQLYQLSSFIRYPELQEIITELWYLDADELASCRYTRAQGSRFMKSFNQRGEAVTSAITFNPKPNIFNCKWCPYGPKGTGHCEKGV